jgi:hypothetical protein
MLYGFAVTPSLAASEPSQAYFKQIVIFAQQALNQGSVTAHSAMDLCEYLDGVDGGSLPMNKALYRQCVAAIGEWIVQSPTSPEVVSMANKSWAAQTLFKLIAGNAANQDASPYLSVAA